MSISDKITSITNHLTADYEGISNLGVDLTNVDKNIENIATCLDSIYSNYPKVSNTGTEVSLNPTNKGKLQIIEKGNSTQDGTPTPSSPISIKSVTGNNNVVVSNTKVFNYDVLNLPSEYQAVEYIESDGNQYLDLNAQYGATNKIQAVVSTNDTYTNNILFTSNSGNSIWIGFSNSANMSSGGFTSMNISPATTNVQYKTLSEITFSYSITTINHIRWGTYGVDTYKHTNRIASLKLYDTSNTLIRNMIACYRISDNVIGMYDLVNNVFYTNAGTGTFTKGDNILIQTLPLNLGSIELNKIGTYQDYIYKSGDKWYKKEPIPSIALGNVTAVSTATIFGVSVKYVAYSLNEYITETQQLNYNFLCNKVSQANGVATKYSGYINGRAFVVIVDDNDTVTTVNQKLAGATLMFGRTTPTDIEITDTTLIDQLNNIEKMKSYNGTTIITSTYDSSNAQMELQVSGLRGN